MLFLTDKIPYVTAEHCAQVRHGDRHVVEMHTGREPQTLRSGREQKQRDYVSERSHRDRHWVHVSHEVQIDITQYIVHGNELQVPGAQREYTAAFVEFIEVSNIPNTKGENS